MKQSTLLILASLLMMIPALTTKAKAESVNPQITDAVTQTNPNAPGATIALKNNTGVSAWITIYNFAGSIRDAGCVNAGTTKNFDNYYGPIGYKVRAQVALSPTDCHGGTIDIDKTVKVSINQGADVSLEQGIAGGYYLQHNNMAVTEEQQMQQAKDEQQKAQDSLGVATQGGGTITLNNHTHNSMWVTVYNYFGSIRDSGCINAGDTRDFNNYYGPLAFKVRAQVANTEKDCHGGNIDISKWISVDPFSGRTLSLEKNAAGGSFFLN